MWVLPLRCGDLENVGVYSSGFPRGKKKSVGGIDSHNYVG